MSLEAMKWVITTAAPKDHADFRLLMLLAEFSGAEGRYAYPSRKTLSEGMGRSVRQVQRGLDSLLAAGFIRTGDQSVIEHLPANRRPVVYDLALDEIIIPERPAETSPARPIRTVGETPGVTPTKMSRETPGVTPKPSPGGTYGVTPAWLRGDKNGRLGVTSDVTQTKNLTKEQKTTTNPLPPTDAELEAMFLSGDVEVTASASGKLAVVEHAPIAVAPRGEISPAERTEHARGVVHAYADALCPKGLNRATGNAILTEVRNLLKDGFDDTVIAGGLRLWHESPMTATSMIAGFVQKFANGPTRPKSKIVAKAEAYAATADAAKALLNAGRQGVLA